MADISALRREAEDMNIYEITSGEYSAKINLSRGANCISLRNMRYHALILREPDYSSELDNPYLYGMPILFPVNRIDGGCFEFEGRIYRFPINEKNTNCALHGELHCMPFQLLEAGKDYVKCRYKTEEPYLNFPHSFQIDIEYSLGEAGLTVETTVTNFSEMNMPVFLGYHTTFNAPFVKDSSAEGLRVFAEVSDEIERNMAVYLPTGRILPPDEISESMKAGEFNPRSVAISRHYRSSGVGTIELRDLSKDVKVVYENDEKLNWRLFYNGNADEYICLEPQTCMANCQNAPFDRKYAGFDYIEPMASKKYWSRIFLTEICE